MIRVYNRFHKAVGKKELGRDSLRLTIPPIGQYVEVEDKHRLAVESIVANSYGALALTPPMIPITTEELSLVDKLQQEVESLRQQLSEAPVKKVNKKKEEE